MRDEFKPFPKSPVTDRRGCQKTVSCMQLMAILAIIYVICCTVGIVSGSPSNGTRDKGSEVLMILLNTTPVYGLWDMKAIGVI